MCVTYIRLMLRSSSARANDGGDVAAENWCGCEKSETTQVPKSQEILHALCVVGSLLDGTLERGLRALRALVVVAYVRANTQGNAW